MASSTNSSFSIQNLYKSIEDDDVQLVKSILASIDLDLNQYPQPLRMSCLHLAVGLNSCEIVSLLLKHGADPNYAACEDGLSPLHLSVLYDHEEILKLLITAGGNPLLKDKEAKNCLDIVKENKLTHLLDQLSLESKTTLLTDNHPHPYQQRLTDSSQKTTTESYYSCKSPQSVESAKVNGHYESLSSITTSSQKSANVQLTDDSLFSPNAVGISNQETYTFILTDDESISMSTYCIPSTSPLLSTHHQRLETIQDVSETSTTTEGNSSDTSSSSNYCVSILNERLPLPLSQEEYDEIKSAAVAHGIPVTPFTVNTLSKFIDPETKSLNLLPPKGFNQSYSMELDYALRNFDVINQWGEHQVKIVQLLNESSKRRGKSGKSYFNYLLLDPFVIKRTNFSGNHLKSGVKQNSEKFDTFLTSIFYIGKGSGLRALQHLVDAKARLKTNPKKRPPDSSKLEKVLNIWGSNQGVIVLSLFHHSLEIEANIVEAAMIDAMGLQHLTNIKKGTWSLAGNWSQKCKNQLGAFLLYKSYCAFLCNDFKAFLPSDV